MTQKYFPTTNSNEEDPKNQKHLTQHGREEAGTPQITLKSSQDQKTPESLRKTSGNSMELGIGSNFT